LPNASTVASCRACRDARLSTSLVIRRERRPSASISVAVCSTSLSLRALGTTSAPASARPRAMAWPSPVVPPMTTATLPVRSKRFWLILEALCGLVNNPLAHRALKFTLPLPKKNTSEIKRHLGCLYAIRTRKVQTDRTGYPFEAGQNQMIQLHTVGLLSVSM